ncbi:transposase [Candidatus Peregrinibacteria bacterium]|nr:transposase [Candidatus Peregrinibacteria bacterium]
MFITTNLQNRKKVFANPAYAREAVEILYRVQKLHPFFLYGFVIMHEHCHFLLMPPDGGSVSQIMRCYKSGVSHGLGLGPIWQSRFHLRIPHNAAAALRYIHLNPVRVGFVQAAEDYPWSSASGRWEVTDLGW